MQVPSSLPFQGEAALSLSSLYHFYIACITAAIIRPWHLDMGSWPCRTSTNPDSQGSSWLPADPTETHGHNTRTDHMSHKLKRCALMYRELRILLVSSTLPHVCRDHTFKCADVKGIKNMWSGREGSLANPRASPHLEGKSGSISVDNCHVGPMLPDLPQ